MLWSGCHGVLPCILLCHSLNCPRLLFVALMAQWHYSLITDKLTATLQVAKRVYSLAQQQNDSAIIMVLAGQALDEVRRELGRDGSFRFSKAMTSAAIEAVNGIIQLAKRMARGFKNFVYFRTVSYYRAGKLNLAVPNIS